MGMSLLFAVAILLHVSHAGAGDLHPLILVPGQGGNQIEARLTGAFKPSSPHCMDHKEEGWFRLWMDYSNFRDPLLIQCFAEQMTLYYDLNKDDYRNAPAVETRVPYFGSTDGFRYKDPDHKQSSEYMETLVKYLEQIGYKDGDNLFGAPYDFRYSLAAEGHPSQVGSQFLHDLKELIEEASVSNGGKPVIILTHSLGGLFVLQLLNRNPLTWRRRFVKHFVALSAPWGGTVIEMMIFASGYTLGNPSVDPLLLRRETQSLESNLWLLPSPKLFGLRPIVVAKSGNYSAFDMSQFFVDIGFKEDVYPYQTRILPLIKLLAAPGVPVTCITGTGIRTPETLLYEYGFNEQPQVVYGDGDGLVNLISLLALETEWSNVSQQVLKVTRIPNISHTSILHEEVALREIIQEISDVNSLILSSIA